MSNRRRRDQREIELSLRYADEDRRYAPMDPGPRPVSGGGRRPHTQATTGLRGKLLRALPRDVVESLEEPTPYQPPRQEPPAEWGSVTWPNRKQWAIHHRRRIEAAAVRRCDRRK